MEQVVTLRRHSFPFLAMLSAAAAMPAWAKTAPTWFTKMAKRGKRKQ
jgi:hypothetical protein